MRFARYLIVVAVLTSTVSLSAAPPDRQREPRVIKKISRFFKYILQPLGDYVSPPHP